MLDLIYVPQIILTVHLGASSCPASATASGVHRYTTSVSLLCSWLPGHAHDTTRGTLWQAALRGTAGFLQPGHL